MAKSETKFFQKQVAKNPNGLGILDYCHLVGIETEDACRAVFYVRDELCEVKLMAATKCVVKSGLKYHIALDKVFGNYENGMCLGAGEETANIDADAKSEEEKKDENEAALAEFQRSGMCDAHILSEAFCKSVQLELETNPIDNPNSQLLEPWMEKHEEPKPNAIPEGPGGHSCLNENCLGE